MVWAVGLFLVVFSLFILKLERDGLGRTMDKLQQQREHFNKISATYQSARSHENHLKLKQLMWDYALVDKGWLDGDIKVLEPMCGFGDGNKILSQYCNNIDYRGFDFSDAVVEALKSQDPGLNVWQQDVTQFQSAPEYDVIILLGGLHHVPSFSGPVVSRLFNSLKSGGRFINLEPTNGNPVFKWARNIIYQRNELFDEETEQAFDVAALRQMFKDSGFVAEDMIYPGLLSYILYYNPDAFPKLNLGNTKLVDFIWRCEKPFLKTIFARWFSFATLSIWIKP